MSTSLNRRTMLLVVAAILALGTGLLLFNYLASVNRSAQTAPPREVLVAANAIPARTHITGELLRVEQRPANMVEPDALAAPQNAIGSIALIDIPAGATITTSKIARGNANAMPMELHPGMRAVAIPIDRVKGVAGLVQAGDRVDVIAIPPRAPRGAPQAYTILRNIRVLAVGARTEMTQATPGPDEAAGAQTATLEVTPQQADTLAAADLNTTLRLALRSPNEPANSVATEPLVYPSEPLQQQPRPSGGAGGVPHAQPPSNHPGIVVINGDAVEH